MKTMIFSLLFSSLSFAQTISCDIEEFFEGRTLEQKLEVVADPSNPHGSMEFFKLQKFTQYEGFIAFIKESAIINIQTENAAFTSTAVGNVTKGEFASLQLLFPSQDTNMAGVLIMCGLKK